MFSEVNDQVCPFCHKNNGCMVSQSTGCWCGQLKVPQELQDLVPAAVQRKSCICAECINKFNKNPSAFKNKL